MGVPVREPEGILGQVNDDVDVVAIDEVGFSVDIAVCQLLVREGKGLLLQAWIRTSGVSPLALFPSSWL